MFEYVDVIIVGALLLFPTNSLIRFGEINGSGNVSDK